MNKASKILEIYNKVSVSPKYSIRLGTVQPYVDGFKDPPFIVHFGLAEYDSKRPILSEYLRIKAQKIIDKLNNGDITEIKARELLKAL